MSTATQAEQGITVTPAVPAATNPGFALYVHWPFCLSKCPYCDFNSHVREAVDQDRWRRALLAELDHYADMTPGRVVTSIFFGGGTPSLMAPETVGAVIQRAGARWHLAESAEVTLEANPTSVEAGRFAAYREAGVNRLSIGVQALNQAALTFLGRQHNVEEALAALDIARRTFAHWTFDLITARPGQTPAAWREEIKRALDEGAEHLSIYHLTIEENTAFHGAQRRGELSLPPENTGAAIFEMTQEILERAGLPAYEISNHAKPGAESRHNLTYWHYGDYVGIGPGAHGRLTLETGKTATRQHRAPEAWLQAVETQGHATRGQEILGTQDRLAELVMMGLRLRGGISRKAFLRESGAEPEQALNAARLSALTKGGFLVLDGEGLRPTSSGRARLNAVIGRLLA